MSPAARWATSWPVLFLAVFLAYQVNVVDSTDNDPELAPFTAASIVRERNLDLDEYPSDALLGHPLVITGRAVPGVEPGQDFEDADTLRGAIAAAGPDARVFDYFPIVPALLAVPAVVTADAIGALTGGPDAVELITSDRFARYHVATSGAIVALAAVMARALALLVLTGDRRRRRRLATATAVVFALGTTAWSVASRALWQHGPSLFLAMTALWLVVRLDPFTGDDDGRSGDDDGDGDPDERDQVSHPGRLAGALGVTLVLAVVARPTNLALVAVLGVWILIRRRDVAVRVALGGLGAAALTASVTLALSGPFPPPYYAASRVLVDATTLEAMAANWVSPSRGLLWVSPVVLLAVVGAVRLWTRPARRPLVIALVANVALLTLSVSAFARWWGGHSFGSRFMTEAVPALLLLALPAVDVLIPGGSSTVSWLATPRRARIGVGVVIVLATWSIGFNGLGAVSRQTSCWYATPVDVDVDPGRVWSITDSQVGRSVGSLITDGPRRMILGPC